MDIKSILRPLLAKTKKDHRIVSGPLRGKRLVTSWHDYPAAILGYAERQLLSWFEENVSHGETWLDVGAHYGYTAIALCELVGSEGRVFAFEPMLNTAGSVSQTRRANEYNQMIVIPFALANQREFAVNQLPTSRGMADSTLQSNDWHEMVIVTGLDWLWPHINRGDGRINGIKIDVQGMEIETVQGLTEILRTHKPKLVIEFHKGVDREEFLCLIESVGYSRNAKPIDPTGREKEAQFFDNRSYSFSVK